MSDNSLQAIYETKREQLMLGWLNSNHRDHINHGYVFAYSVRMYPYFQQNTTKDDIFADQYDIKTDVVREVIEYIDKIWLKNPVNSKLEFYNLEQHFTGKADRADLIQIIRYCAISRRFSDDFFKTVMSNAPCEANAGLDDPLSEDDLAITGF